MQRRNDFHFYAGQKTEYININSSMQTGSRLNQKKNKRERENLFRLVCQFRGVERKSVKHFAESCVCVFFDMCLLGKAHTVCVYESLRNSLKVHLPNQRTSNKIQSPSTCGQYNFVFRSLYFFNNNKNQVDVSNKISSRPFYIRALQTM